MFDLATISGQDTAERLLSIAIGKAKQEAANNGLEAERIVRALRAALEQEERLLAERRANERSY